MPQCGRVSERSRIFSYLHLAVAHGNCRGLSVHSTLDGSCLASATIRARRKPATFGGKTQPVHAMLWVWRTLLVAASEEVRRPALGILSPVLISVAPMYILKSYTTRSQSSSSHVHLRTSSIRLDNSTTPVREIRRTCRSWSRMSCLWQAMVKLLRMSSWSISRSGLWTVPSTP